MWSNTDAAMALEGRLRLESMPVALKLVTATQDRPAGLLEKTKTLTFCQFVAAAAAGGYPLWMSRLNLGCPHATIAFGLYDPQRESDYLDADVRMHIGAYAPNEEIARKLVSVKPAIPPGRVVGVAVAPLAKASFKPDAVIMVVVPFQVYMALDDYFYATGDAPTQIEVGCNSLTCAYCGVMAAHFGKIAATTACTGGRTLAGFEKTQMTLGIPGSKLEALLTGMAERSKAVPYPGMIAMPAPAPMPPKHILAPDD